MADELVQQTAPDAQVVEQQQQPDYTADLKAQMHIALNGGMPLAEAEAAADAAQALETTVVADATVNDPFGLFKEKFGYETPDAAIREIEELRAYRAQSRPNVFNVPDDETGAMARAISSGKKEDVWKLLDQEIRVERLLGAEVTNDVAADIVKMGMALKYKDLTPAELTYKFNKQYAMPPEPKQAFEEDDADFQQRVGAWKEQVADKQMELMIDAKLAKPELQNSKVKFTFPEIDTPVDEGYIQYKKMLEATAQRDERNKAAYQKLSPQEIETKLNFKDEANKIAFEFQYVPDADMFNKAVDIANDAEKYWGLFHNSDGTSNQRLFLESIMYAMDKSKVLLSAMNQTKNATIKAGLPDNNEGGLVRQIPQSQEPNELDQMMRARLHGYGGFK